MLRKMRLQNRRCALQMLLITVAAILLLSQPQRTLAQQWTTNGNNINNTNTGNVGIGTTSPTQKLTVAGTIGADSGGIVIPTPGTTSGRFQAVVSDWIGTTLNATYGSTGWVLDDPSKLGWFLKLDSRPFSTQFAVYKIPAGAGGHTNEYPVFSISGADTAMFSGNVGIGTTAPMDKLHIVNGSVNVQPNSDFSLAGNLVLSGNSSLGPYIAGNTDSLGNATVNAAAMRATYSALGFVVSSSPATPSGTARTFTDKLIVNPSGNVGIGTTEPIAKLDVNGNINVTGNIAAKYQDVAEWVSSRQALAAGTVVVLDTERSNQVLASTRAYDTGVAGVVSSRPGITLGESGEGKVLIATTGRVKVKVDATRAPIRVGDLLVTSDKEGIAMRSEPLDLGGVPIHRPGTLVGKALEPLARGTGEILVLLSLQ